MTERTVPHVGTLREKPLHASLKAWYAEPGDEIEVPVDGFVIDLVRGPLLIEIQTRGFSSMKRKLSVLLENHPVRIVHPIAVDRWIVRIGDGGEILSRRRSPKHGDAVDVFTELVSFPEMMNSPNLSLDVLLTREDEIRTHDPARAWRRKGWVVQERRLIEVVDSHRFATPTDLAELLPPLPDAFTTGDLATALDRPMRLAQQVAYCLRHCGLIEQTDKRGNAIVYQRSTEDF